MSDRAFDADPHVRPLGGAGKRGRFQGLKSLATIVRPPGEGVAGRATVVRPAGEGMAVPGNGRPPCG